MKKNSVKLFLFLIFTGFVIMGCGKNETRYYDDAGDTGLAIFSNTGNNILSCFIEGKPWRTASRTTHAFGPGTSYEVEIMKQQTGSFPDTLLIRWYGYFQSNDMNLGYLTLHLAIPQNFTYRYLNNLQGQRLRIDTTNGFFSTNISGLNAANTRGSGSIYFHAARFDSIAPGSYSGNMDGLMEADFTSFKITRGRFDHIIDPEQVHL